MTEAEKLVEECARALCEADGMRWEDQGDPMRSATGGDDREAYLNSARAAISVTLTAVDSKLDDLLARYPSAVTEWSAAVREIRRSLFPRSP